MWLIIAVRVQLEIAVGSILAAPEEKKIWDPQEYRGSGEGTHNLQSLRDTIHSALVSIPVLVIRKWIERILTLFVLYRISPAWVNVRMRRRSAVIR
jgi:hypothetical protein